MTKLWEIAEEFKSLNELVESGELTSEQIADTLEATEGEFQDKGKAIAMFIENVGSDVDQLDLMIKNLTARKKRLANKQESLRSYLADNMHRTGVTKIQSTEMTISYVKPRMNVVVDCDPLELDFDYQIVEIKANKKAIGDAIKEGIEVNGARIEPGKPSIRIKV